MMSPPQGCSSCSRSSCRRRCWGSNWPDPRSCSCSPYQGARRQDCIEIEEKKMKQWTESKIEKFCSDYEKLKSWKLQNWFWEIEQFRIGFETCYTPEQGHLARVIEVHFSHLWTQFDVFVLPDCYDGITFRSKWSRLSNLDDRHLEGNEPGVLPDERPQGAADAEDRHAEEEADSKKK